MTGAPIPYHIGNDNLFLLLFIMNILGMSYLFLTCGNNLLERTKSLFYYKKQSNPYGNRINIGLVGNIFLYAQDIFCFVIITFGYLQYNGENNFGQKSHIAIAAFATLLTAFLLAKWAIYEIVNTILFTRKQAREWRLSYFFTTQLTGFILFPLATAIIFWPTIPEYIYWGYLIFVAILYLYMLFIRCFNIVFAEKCNYFDIFLYLCAIELLPLGLLCKAILVTNSFLTIKL